MPDVTEILVDEIGLDPRPVRQIRPLDVEHVRNLMDTTNPAEWDPIEVRLWPATDPYPSGEEGRPYQVISGYHRTTAARNLGRSTIRAIIIDEPLDDLGFQLRAFRTNARHGKPMSTDEKCAVALLLRAHGMTENEIADAMGTPRGTVHNWVSGRDTNANRKDVRTHKASGDSGAPDGLPDGLPDAWHVPSVTLDARREAQVGSAIHDCLATTPTNLAPGDVLAWASKQSPQIRHELTQDVTDMIAWLNGLHAALAVEGVA